MQPAPPSHTRDRVDWRRVWRFVGFCGGALLAVGFVAAVYWPLLLPLCLASFLTYLLLPLVDRLEQWGARRSLAILALIVSTLTVVAIVVVRVAPVLYQQAQLLVRLVPDAANTVMQSWVPLAEKYVHDLGLMSPDQVERLFEGLNVATQLEAQARAGLAGLWETGTTFVGGVFNFVLVPFIAFFMLKDYRRLKNGVTSLVPQDLEEPLGTIALRVDATLRSVIKGQAIVAGILAVLYAIGLSIVGIQSAIAIGVVAGICRLIPYFDVVVGATLSTLVILSDFGGWGQVLGVVLVLLVVQTIDGAFITPRVIGERVGLHPMVVVLSVLAFAHWFGFWGVLLAIPVVAVVKVLLSEAQPYYLASPAYTSQVPEPLDGLGSRDGDNDDEPWRA